MLESSHTATEGQVITPQVHGAAQGNEAGEGATSPTTGNLTLTTTNVGDVLRCGDAPADCQFGTTVDNGFTSCGSQSVIVLDFNLSTTNGGDSCIGVGGVEDGPAGSGLGKSTRTAYGRTTEISALGNGIALIDFKGSPGGDANGTACIEGTSSSSVTKLQGASADCGTAFVGVTAGENQSSASNLGDARATACTVRDVAAVGQGVIGADIVSENSGTCESEVGVSRYHARGRSCHIKPDGPIRTIGVLYEERVVEVHSRRTEFQSLLGGHRSHRNRTRTEGLLVGENQRALPDRGAASVGVGAGKGRRA